MAKNLAVEKWRSSGIDDKTAAKLGLKLVDGREAGRISPKFTGLRCLLIPYFSPSGKRTSFTRIRRLESPKGFAALDPKFQRYAQPAGTAPEVYLPPLVAWAQVLKNPTHRLLITEGELKAACACRCGHACIGLGGVDSWRSKKKGIALVQALADAEWKTRKVTIVYDSDASVKPDVMRAALELAAELTNRGAEVSIASLPPSADGKKQGLDDFVIAKGPRALDKVLEDARPLGDASPLWAMNEEVVFIRDPGLIMVREDGLKLSPDQFVRHHYSNRHFMVMVDGKPKQFDTAKEWLHWRSRFEVKRLTYCPGKGRIIDGAFNTWNGLGVEPKKGDVRPFLELLDFVLDGLTKEQRKWFMQWCAYPLQNLGAKMFSCVAFWSPEQGVGKSFVAYFLQDIYGTNGVEIKTAQLEGSFNGWAENRQFIIGDEITGNDARGFADKLKGLITQEQVSINAKYVAEFTIPDRANWFFTSNHPDAFYLDDADRRFFVHHVKGKPRDDKFYAHVDAFRRHDGSAKVLRYLLEEVDCSDFRSKVRPPVTAAKEAMTYDAKPALARWVSELKHDPEDVLKFGEMKIKKDLFTATELLAMFDPTGSKNASIVTLGRELARAFLQLPKNATSTHGSQRLYVVRNPDKWEKAKPWERAQHWEGQVLAYGTEKKEKY